MIHSFNKQYTFQLLMNGQKIYKPELYNTIIQTDEYKEYEQGKRYKVCLKMDKMFGLNTAMEEL